MGLCIIAGWDPRCQRSLFTSQKVPNHTADALYCRACSMALTEHAAYQVEEKTEEAEKSDEYQNLLNRLRRDLGVNL